MLRLTFTTGLLTHIWYPGTQLRAVVELIIASVGGDGGHAGAETAGLLALSPDVFVPAVALGQVGAVVVGVRAVRRVGGRGRRGGRRHRGARGGGAGALRAEWFTVEVRDHHVANTSSLMP